MTRHFGPGEYHVGGWSDDVDKVTFGAREYFVDVLAQEVPEAVERFREDVESTVRDVFDAHGDREALRVLLEQGGGSWDWPPREWPRYGEGFLGSAPTPPGTLGKPLDETMRILQYCALSWPFYGWRLTTLLRDFLDSWSEKRNLQQNPCVASHLLARICKAHFISEDGKEPGDETKLDHRVFPSLGVLAWFPDSLGDFFPFREWDPTQERWSDWRKAAEARFREALNAYKDRVQEEARRRNLESTPTKREAERDFRFLIRFQVLGETHEKIAEESGFDDVKVVQKCIRRTAELAGLVLRTDLGHR